MSSASFSPGMEAGMLDQHLVRPHTSWRGHRGVSVTFGSLGDIMGIEDEVDMLLFEIELEEEDEDEDEDFGLLYKFAPFSAFPADPLDAGIIQGHSGTAGYRGARTRFRNIAGSEARPKESYRYGGTVETPYLTYKGGPESFMIAMGVLAVLYRTAGGDPSF